MFGGIPVFAIPAGPYEGVCTQCLGVRAWLGNRGACQAYEGALFHNNRRPRGLHGGLRRRHRVLM